MSSKKEHSEPTNSGKSVRKKHENKKKSQEEDYKKKSKSSPALSPLASEKVVLFECKASSKPTNLAASSSSKSVKSKHNEGKKPQSTQKIKSDIHGPVKNFPASHMEQKNLWSRKNSNTISLTAKNKQQNASHVSRFMSPQFMSLASQSQPQIFNKNYSNPGGIQCSFPQSSLNSGIATTQFINRFPQPQRNLNHPAFHQKVQSARLDNQCQKGIYNQKPYQKPFVVNTSIKCKSNAIITQKNVQTQFVNSKHIAANTNAQNSKSNVSFIKQTSTPQIKYKKNKINPVSCSSEKRKTRVKKRNINVCYFKKKINEPKNPNVAPLLSFHCGQATSEKNLDLMKFDDDEEEDDRSVISDHSVNNVADLIDFSENPPVSQPSIDYNLIDLSDESYLVSNRSENVSNASNISENLSNAGTDSDSSDESSESDTSEFSVNSSIVSNESCLNLFKPDISKEAFISVFWDIENCSLPSEKSAVDFASYVRDIFYKGRTEVQFIAACDVSNLSSVIVRELDEAAITLIHISSVNKNAADKKIQGLLQKYQLQYRKTNSAIVLISSDSDFSQFLLDMRYQHHIYVNLICRKETRDSLITSANEYVFLEDIIIKLPDRNVKNNLQHILVITNLPKLNYKQIKNCLSEKLNSFNCRIKVSESNAKIIFKDHSVCHRAMNSLKGYYLGGNALHIAYQTELNEIIPKKAKNSNISCLNEKRMDSSSTSENMMSDFPEEKGLNGNCVASLSIYVSTYLGNVEYWKNIFQNTWKTTEFSLSWEGSLLDGFFLVNFKSLKKAQKVKKLLVKNQINDLEAPKFLKLVKSGKGMISLDGHIMNSSEDLSKKKIEDCILIIEQKKKKLLQNHETMMNKMKNQNVSNLDGVSETMSDKLRECVEQMETFINFVNMTINIIKILYCADNLDIKLKDLFSDFTRECNCFSTALPIYAKKENILKEIKNHQVLIIRAETGSGKSTQLTQYIWRDRYVCANGGKIICTQPRKIAAISLAKYVSSQIGCKLGDIVGYKVGVSSKLSANTKIVYVTDFTMLKMLVSEDLSGVSCIIIDEAHERTIYTDILIGMIKQYIPRYPHLKIVITSATIDTSIFREYFTMPESSVLQISGRTFPVEDVWLDKDVTPDWDYFNNSIDKAFEILTEDPGDVLLFLTTPLETEKACEKFTEKLKGCNKENTVKVYYLHGKMNYEEQQKVFEKNAKGIRKVIFATNCAETSITIPGIKYVVDCGLVKESQYDATRNMNILSVGFVSKSSAEQRKGRAGRTHKGKCYRLFSKANYKNMADNTNPEILRINLGQALMKLMKMGIRNPLQFDFLQSPSIQQLTLAMDQLIYLKAVDKSTFTLTELGNKMAVLPFEPRLCHLIFQGFDYSIGYDCLVVAALVTMSHTIFFRNSENKDEADKKKRRFCESESDFISYLEVYKEWVDVPKNLKSQWCVINCINARSMRTVHELVSEIILILEKELLLKVKMKFSSEESYDTLTKTIFYSFSQNLSVFSGHPKLGYKCLNTSDRLLIHPSSSLSSFGLSTPKFVIYDTILKTSRTFMVNISPVTEKMIFDAFNLHNLSIDVTDIENLSEFEVVPYSYKPLGEKIIINNFIGKKGIKRKNLELKIKECTSSDFVEIDINIPDGCVTVYSFCNKYDEISSIVLPIIRNAQEVFLNEEHNLYFEDKSFTAIVGAGGFIHDVILPGEFTDIKVILKDQGNIESVIEKLSTCGIITETREWKKYFRVTFKTPAAAAKALITYYNENDFSLQSIHKSLPLGKDHLYKVLLTSYRRPCIGVAYITVDQPIPPFLLPSSVTFNDIIARVTLSKKTGDIRITNLPLNTDKTALESVVTSILPSNIKIKKIIISRKKPYETNAEEMEALKRNILNLFAEFTYKGNIEVYLKKPAAKDFTWNATVFIKDCRAGETAVNILKNRINIPNFLGGFILRPELQTYLYCKSEVFSVVKDEIEEALQFFKKNQPVGNELDIKAVEKWTGTIEIKILSNNIADITDVRRVIHGIISGDKLTFPTTSNKEKMFTHTGKKFMKSLAENNRDCFILQNDYNKTITIFGKEDSINDLKRAINEFLTKFENYDCKDISLKTNCGRSIFKELLKKYGYDLQLLKEACDVSDIKFINSTQIMTILGNPSSILKCELIIQDIKKNLETDCIQINGETCPVCFDEVSENKHRLEYCGHVYCTECLLHLFQNSEDIPLNCDVCQEPIVWVDIFLALNGRKSLEKSVYEKFLHSFIASRNDISFCPSPDCPMIFRVTEDSSIFKCVLCGNSICTHCQELYHYGMSCSFYKCIKSDTDYSLKAWIEEDPSNRKQCPSCNSPIEKNGGCNHMTCWKCKVHMCWLCLKDFPTGDEVYIHLGVCPGRNV